MSIHPTYFDLATPLRAFCFAGPYVWNSLLEHNPATNINSCLQALTQDISAPADIAPSALETTISCCFIGYISALTYYLLLNCGCRLQRYNKVAGSAPGTPCTMDSSSLGARRRLGHDATSTAQQGR